MRRHADSAPRARSLPPSLLLLAGCAGRRDRRRSQQRHGRARAAAPRPPPPACDDVRRRHDVVRARTGRPPRRPWTRSGPAARCVVGVSADTLLMGSRNPLSGPDRGLRHRHAARGLGGDLRRRPEPAAVPGHHVRPAARRAGEPRGRPGGPHVHHELRALGDHRVLRRVPARRARRCWSRATRRRRASRTSAGTARLRTGGHDDARRGCRRLPRHRRRSAPRRTPAAWCCSSRARSTAITGDDTILAGFAAQDPYAKVVGDAFSAEPYGIGVAGGPGRPRAVRQRGARPGEGGRHVGGDLRPLAAARSARRPRRRRRCTAGSRP